MPGGVRRLDDAVDALGPAQLVDRHAPVHAIRPNARGPAQVEARVRAFRVVQDDVLGAVAAAAGRVMVGIGGIGMVDVRQRRRLGARRVVAAGHYDSFRWSLTLPPTAAPPPPVWTVPMAV